MHTFLLPPIWFSLCLASILLVPGTGMLPLLPRLAGSAVPLLLGIGLLASARAAYLSNGSEIHTFRTPRGLVTTGVFRLSRNPMYLGFVLILIAAAFARATLMSPAPVALFAALCAFVYVPFEERAAEKAFGEPYRQYRARTPRWLGLPS